MHFVAIDYVDLKSANSDCRINTQTEIKQTFQNTFSSPDFVLERFPSAGKLHSRHSSKLPQSETTNAARMDTPKSGRSATTEASSRATPKSPGPSTANRTPFAFPSHRTASRDDVEVRFRGGERESVSLQPGGIVNYGRSVSETAERYISHPPATTTGSDLYYTSEHSITPQSSKTGISRSSAPQNSDILSQEMSALNGRV